MGGGDQGEVPGEAGERGPSEDPGEAQAAVVPTRPLSLGDPLDGRASEDRPESWGERGESESDRLAHYRTQTPPHHGS